MPSKHNHCSQVDHSNYNEWIRCIQRQRRHRNIRENNRPIREINMTIQKQRGVGKPSIQLLFGENGFEGLDAQPSNAKLS